MSVQKQLDEAGKEPTRPGGELKNAAPAKQGSPAAPSSSASAPMMLNQALKRPTVPVHQGSCLGGIAKCELMPGEPEVRGTGEGMGEEPGMGNEPGTKPGPKGKEKGPAQEKNQQQGEGDRQADEELKRQACSGRWPTAPS